MASTRNQGMDIILQLKSSQIRLRITSPSVTELPRYMKKCMNKAKYDTLFRNLLEDEAAQVRRVSNRTLCVVKVKMPELTRPIKKLKKAKKGKKKKNKNKIATTTESIIVNTDKTLPNVTVVEKETKIKGSTYKTTAYTRSALENTFLYVKKRKPKSNHYKRSKYSRKVYNRRTFCFPTSGPKMYFRSKFDRKKQYRINSNIGLEIVKLEKLKNKHYNKNHRRMRLKYFKSTIFYRRKRMNRHLKQYPTSRKGFKKLNPFTYLSFWPRHNVVNQSPNINTDKHIKKCSHGILHHPNTANELALKTPLLVFVVGSSGAGKSLLINSLLSFKKPNLNKQGSLSLPYRNQGMNLVEWDANNNDDRVPNLFLVLWDATTSFDGSIWNFLAKYGECLPRIIGVITHLDKVVKADRNVVAKTCKQVFRHNVTCPCTKVFCFHSVRNHLYQKHEVAMLYHHMKRLNYV